MEDKLGLHAEQVRWPYEREPRPEVSSSRKQRVERP
jgi:hypothetical protein